MSGNQKITSASQLDLHQKITGKSITITCQQTKVLLLKKGTHGINNTYRWVWLQNLTINAVG